ncbi:HAD-IIB family hydrolase [Paenibacillus sp. KQZ6P-2]|uniref:HAD-IIB family hydrolase n=1 Tax=Paenibacillus mangrovi TaxID=2931978 RepID=A0A9X1WPS8_9BACL|nr:HAD-IIB family hydrolase [Paenibacillus mangrovi]MCJ8012471.1 HAD-IIB family hydrolase [Paenibacillus mangrovi]
MKFVFDLDGTICFQGKALSSVIVKALDELTRHGHDVIFASARPIRDLLPVLPTHMHAYPMVGGNGAFVAKDKNIISTVHFEEDVKNQLLTIIEEHDLKYLIDSEWDYAYTGSEDHPIRRNVDPEKRANLIPLASMGTIIKIVLLEIQGAEHQLILDKLSALPVVVHQHGNEAILDISPREIDKWSGLKKLGLEDQSYVAFGNDANDLTMFQHAHTSVMIGSHKELGSFATEQSPADEALIAERLLAFCKQNECMKH